jgi:hypothetical protein
MFSWAHQRQLIYGISVIVFLLIFIGVPIYFLYFYQKPNCFDLKMNGTEIGIDCGGDCERACTQEVLPEPIVLWARSFTVARGLHNLVAYVQNPNVNYVAEPVEYLFRVYDKDNVLLGTRIGRAIIPPLKNFPIFEQAFDAGELQPGKVFFEFTEPLIWKRAKSSTPELEIVDEQLINQSSTPRITAGIQNKTINRYSNIEVVAIVYDEKGNAAASSKTVVDVLQGGEELPIQFNWPLPFKFSVSKIEIVPKLSN